jgi:16S rRNA G966 N2-methylase RsmD
LVPQLLDFTEPRDLQMSAQLGDVTRLYADALPVARTGALYNAFSYPTKISAESVALFIASHTAPGDTVADVFAGSGSTGIGALLCDAPTATMKDAADALGLNPEWGPRHAVIYDISQIATFSARTLTHPPSPVRFRSAARALLEDARAALPDLYASTDADGKQGQLRHIVWSEVLICAYCSGVTLYAEACVRFAPMSLSETFTCRCGGQMSIKDCERQTENYNDHITCQVAQRRVRVPWRVYGKTGTRPWSRPVRPDDLDMVRLSEARKPPEGSPVVELAWGDLHRNGYHHGITHLHHLYTARNFLAIATLWSLIDGFDEDVQDALRLLVLSFNATHSTLMTRVVVKQNSKDFIVTGAQSGVLYVSALPVEKNVFAGVERKVATFAAAFELLVGSTSTVDVVTGSSSSLLLEDESVQYVFTDPPFGDYIPYSEVNQINELWLGTVTDNTQEAIISPAQGKTVTEYERLLTDIFAEVARVMTPDASVTVVFHSAKAAIWRALANALEAARLGVELSSVLDKRQPSFKQVVSEVGTKGDPLLLLTKNAFRTRTSCYTAHDNDLIILEVLRRAATSTDAAEQEFERLFSRYVALCVEKGTQVGLGVAEFNRRVEDLDVER